MSNTQLAIISILGGIGVGVLIGLPLVFVLRRRFPAVKKSQPPNNPPVKSSPVQSPPAKGSEVKSPEVKSPPVQSPVVESPEAERPAIKSPVVRSPETRSPPVKSPAEQDSSVTVPQARLTPAPQPYDLLEELRKKRREAEEKELKSVAKEYEALAETFKKFEEESKPAEEQTKVKVPNLFLEVENNLTVATKPWSNTLFNFQTEVFDSNRAEVDSLPIDIRGDLMQAYMDMRLANNLVRLAREAGQKSREVDESYIKLCEQIALRLQKVMPGLTAG